MLAFGSALTAPLPYPPLDPAFTSGFAKGKVAAVDPVFDFQTPQGGLDGMQGEPCAQVTVAR